VDTVDSYYDVSKTAIKDQSMLGAHGQELCNNLDVHWMTQTCDAGKNETETGKCFAYVCISNHPGGPLYSGHQFS